jgi:N4-gp56 family major capsid protein
VPGILTSTAEVPPAVEQWFNRRLLVRVTPRLVHSRMAMREPMPKNSGRTVVFRRFEALPLALAPLAEGNPPTGKVLDTTEVTSTIRQWGDYVTVSDFAEMVVESRPLRQASNALAEQAAQTIDALGRDAYSVGTNVFYGGAVASRALLTTVTHKVDQPLLERMTRALDNANTMRFTEMITASTRISTFPIRPAYWAVVHPNVTFSLRRLTDWINVEEYSSQGGVLEAEVGAWGSIRFLESTQAKFHLGGGGTAAGDVKSTGGLADVYTILLFGKEAVGVVPLSGETLENILHPAGSGGVMDPLDQRATSGWKRVGTELILNDLFLARGEVTVGDMAA